MYRSLLFCICLAGVAHAQTAAWHSSIEVDKHFQRPSRDATLDRETSFRVLLTADTFATGAVGYAGEAPVEVRSFQQLMQEKHRSALFLDVFNRGTDVAKLYALCGLYLTDREQFVTSKKTLLPCDRKVETQDGCCVIDEKLGDVVENPSENVVTLKKGQTLREWHKSNPDVKQFFYDISGGAYPADLVDN